MHAAVAPKLHRKLCERHSGIGADGILLLLPSDAPHLFGRMVITNSRWFKTGNVWEWYSLCCSISFRSGRGNRWGSLYSWN